MLALFFDLHLECAYQWEIIASRLEAGLRMPFLNERITDSEPRPKEAVAANWHGNSGASFKRTRPLPLTAHCILPTAH